jgi:hypothetical protein
MYYICKFSETWSIYDGFKNNSRQLESKEVECLKILFPKLTGDDGKILSAIQISSINPNKLLQLGKPENPGVSKKKVT